MILIILIFPLPERWSAVSPPAGPTVWHSGATCASLCPEAGCPHISSWQHGAPGAGSHHCAHVDQSLLARHVQLGVGLHWYLWEVYHGMGTLNQHHFWPPPPLMSAGGPCHRLHQAWPGKWQQKKCTHHDWHFQQFTQAVMMKNQEDVTVTKVLVHEWFQWYGVPERIHSDQG